MAAPRLILKKSGEHGSARSRGLRGTVTSEEGQDDYYDDEDDEGPEIFTRTNLDDGDPREFSVARQQL